MTVAEAHAAGSAASDPWAQSHATTISPPTCCKAISTPAAPTSRPISTRAARSTYGQLADRVARFGAALRGFGIRREERVLMALLDTVDWPTAFLGCLKAGIIAVPVNTLLTEDDYRFMLADSRAKCLVVSEALFPKFEKLIKQSPDLEHVIVSGDNPHGHRSFEDLVGAGEAGGLTPRRPPPTTWRSGSTPRARPASRRARCMCTPASSSPPISTARRSPA